MSKIFLVQNSDNASIAQVINSLAKIYGTPRLVFSDIGLELREKQIQGFVEGQEEVSKYLVSRFSENMGNIAFDRSELGRFADAVIVQHSMNEDVLFIEFDNDEAKSLVLLINPQAVLNAPEKLSSYEDFLQAARKLATYFGNHYSEDETLRDLIQGVINARVKHEEC